MPSNQTQILHRNYGIQAKLLLPHSPLMNLWHNQKTIIDQKIDYFNCNFPSTLEVFQFSRLRHVIHQLMMPIDVKILLRAVREFFSLGEE